MENLFEGAPWHAPWLTIIAGHYGVGKTNLSLNAVRDLRCHAPRDLRPTRVTLVDLDIVNPYFRSTDNRAFLEAHGIEVLGPVHGATNLDTPSLSPGIDEAIRSAGAQHAVLVDVGGDADGARALGRFAATVAARPYRMVFVVNLSRPETASVAANLELLHDIEAASRLVAGEVFGNTHLKELTTASDIVAAAASTRAVAEAAALPLTGVTAPRALAAEVAARLPDVPVYPIDPIVATPWERQTR